MILVKPTFNETSCISKSIIVYELHIWLSYSKYMIFNNFQTGPSRILSLSRFLTPVHSVDLCTTATPDFCLNHNSCTFCIRNIWLFHFFSLVLEPPCPLFCLSFAKLNRAFTTPNNPDPLLIFLILGRKLSFIANYNCFLI